MWPECCLSLLSSVLGIGRDVTGICWTVSLACSWVPACSFGSATCGKQHLLRATRLVAYRRGSKLSKDLMGAGCPYSHHLCQHEAGQEPLVSQARMSDAGCRLYVEDSHRLEICVGCRLYIEEEIYHPENQAPPLGEGFALSAIRSKARNYRRAGTDVGEILQASQRLAHAQSDRQATATRLLPPVHWALLYTIGSLFVSTFILFETGGSFSNEGRHILFTVLCGLMSFVLCVSHLWLAALALPSCCPACCLSRTGAAALIMPVTAACKS